MKGFSKTASLMKRCRSFSKECVRYCTQHQLWDYKRKAWATALFFFAKWTHRTHRHHLSIDCSHKLKLASFCHLEKHTVRCEKSSAMWLAYSFSLRRKPAKFGYLDRKRIDCRKMSDSSFRCFSHCSQQRQIICERCDSKPVAGKIVISTQISSSTKERLGKLSYNQGCRIG